MMTKSHPSFNLIPIWVTFEPSVAHGTPPNFAFRLDT